MMSTVTVIIQNAPYQSDNKAWHALRFAGAARRRSEPGGIHCRADGVRP